MQNLRTLDDAMASHCGDRVDAKWSVGATSLSVDTWPAAAPACVRVCERGCLRAAAAAAGTAVALLTTVGT